MNISDWIGFFISIGAVAFLVLRQVWGKKHQPFHPEIRQEREPDQASSLEQALRALDINIESEDFIPPPKQVKKVDLLKKKNLWCTLHPRPLHPIDLSLRAILRS